VRGCDGGSKCGCGGIGAEAGRGTVSGLEDTLSGGQKHFLIA
jgi:hypothetical protein